MKMPLDARYPAPGAQPPLHSAAPPPPPGPVPAPPVLADEAPGPAADGRLFDRWFEAWARRAEARWVREPAPIPLRYY